MITTFSISLRDVTKAMAMVNDRFKKDIQQMHTDSFIVSNEDIASDVEQLLADENIEYTIQPLKTNQWKKNLKKN